MRAQEVDYIIIGSGSAGSVLANRLSAHPSIQVALIEAGPSDRGFPTNIKARLPIGNIFLLPDARFNWKYSLDGGATGGNRDIPFPRGKIFGGSSAINGSVYIRGHREDYDAWVAAGNDGWSYDDVLPDYRDMERYRGPASHFHGTSGELDVQRPKSGNPLSYALVRAGVEAGLSANEDFNGPTQDGIGRYDVNQHNGTRVSSARAFLHPVMGRANLLVHAKTLARRIVIENGRATGVELEHAGQRFVLRANAEIIACGGAINSPQLLMLSGIGPSAQLRRHTIDVVADLPGVGANLQDHASVYVAMENPSGEAYALSRKSFLQVIASPFQYLFNRTGMLASNVAEAGAFIRTSELVSRPDIQMTLLVGLKSTALTIPRQHGYMIIVQLLRPNSRGTVKLATSRPEDKPSIELNFGADDRDLRTLMQGIRAARKILAQPALAGMNGKELSPGSMCKAMRHWRRVCGVP